MFMARLLSHVTPGRIWEEPRLAVPPTLKAEHPQAAHVGLVVYPGYEVVELRKNVWGVPDWYLLGTL